MEVKLHTAKTNLNEDTREKTPGNVFEPIELTWWGNL